MTLRLTLAAALLVSGSAFAAEPGKPPITAQVSASGGPLDPAQKKLRFDTADLQFEVDPDREVLNGVATLTFTTLDRTDKVVVDLDNNYTVTAVTVDGVDASFQNPQGRMTITLAKKAAKDAKLVVKITYGGRPHTAVRAPWDGGFVWAKTPGGQPWVATAVQMEGCDLFWPCIDYPTYEPDKVTLHITVPKGLKAPSNGKLLGVDQLQDGRTTWNWEVAHPNLYGIALNVGPYEEISGTYKSKYGDTIPMHYWYLPGETEQAKGLFAEFAPTLDFYEGVVGPYPWRVEKVGVVETPHKGMEHQTINAYGNAYAKAPEGFDWLFQHEFGHEWFANQMTAVNWDDFWLHEGFTAYMQPLYGRWREGDGRYTAMMLAARPGIQNKSPLVTGKPQTAEDVYEKAPGRGGDIYTKGEWILHTLRNAIGDKAFFDAVKLLVYNRTDPAPGNFQTVFRTTPDFIRFINQTTGQDWQWFFDVYLYQATLPKLVANRNASQLTLKWQTPLNKPFPLPVEVQIDDRVQKVPMTGGLATITVPEGAHVVIDPMSRLLKQDDAVDAYQAWRAAQAPAAAKK
ncbi:MULTISPECIES: M1 family metallopeptidase [unclassified Sphingomonas]|jgi:aminopeptidase N|uniref:M1 family metallopeptidase n=1 Tax=unclassified Sphingomonas TaxID=196159 RepID=UPI000E1025E8|nr:MULTISPECIES: M1 family metallopeptidase [unclassified Sphingomonas]AXJ94312.1 M1 family peptidase [Sphingomonas sp. FARSPH]